MAGNAPYRNELSLKKFEENVLWLAQLLQELYDSNVLNSATINDVDSQVTPQSKVAKLLKFAERNFNFLWELNSKVTDFKNLDTRLRCTDGIQDLSSKLKRDTQQILQEHRKIWKDLALVLPSVVKHALLIIEQDGKLTRSKSENTYAYLTAPQRRIFVVAGDPGVGKTTYVMNLLENWSYSMDDSLRYFYFLFWVRCEDTRHVKSLTDLLIEVSSSKFCAMMDHFLASDRTLIIFDGFDENPMPEILKLLREKELDIGDRRVEIRAKFLITTKSSTLNSIGRRDMLLQLTGYNAEEALEVYSNGKKSFSIEFQMLLKRSFVSNPKLRNPLLISMLINLDHNVTSNILRQELHTQVYYVFENFFAEFNDDSNRECLSHIKAFAAMLTLRNQTYEVPEIRCNYEPNIAQLLKCKVIRASSRNELVKAKTIFCRFYHNSFAEYFAAKWVADNQAIWNKISFNFLPETFRYLLLSNLPSSFYKTLLAEENMIHCAAISFETIYKMLQNRLSKNATVCFSGWVLEFANLKPMMDEYPDLRLEACHINFGELENNDFRFDAQVKSIALSDCSISDGFAALGQLSKLQILLLEMCKFDAQNFTNKSSNFPQLKKLTISSLARTGLNADILYMVCSPSANKLIDVDIRGFELNENEISAIKQLIAKDCISNFVLSLNSGALNSSVPFARLHLKNKTKLCIMKHRGNSFDVVNEIIGDQKQKVKKLKLESCAIYNNIAMIVNMLPNVQHLTVAKLRSYSETQTSISETQLFQRVQSLKIIIWGTSDVNFFVYFASKLQLSSMKIVIAHEINEKAILHLTDSMKGATFATTMKTLRIELVEARAMFLCHELLKCLTCFSCLKELKLNILKSADVLNALKDEESDKVLGSLSDRLKDNFQVYVDEKNDYISYDLIPNMQCESLWRREE